MPPGRDSFRRNRVAPCSNLYFTTGGDRLPRASKRSTPELDELLGRELVLHKDSSRSLEPQGIPSAGPFLSTRLRREWLQRESGAPHILGGLTWRHLRRRAPPKLKHAALKGGATLASAASRNNFLPEA